MYTARAQRVLGLAYDRGAEGLAEFDAEPDRVEPQFSIVKSPAAEPVPSRRRDRERSPLLVAFVWVALLALSGGVWLGVYLSEPVTVPVGLAVAAVRDDPHVRALANQVVPTPPLPAQPSQPSQPEPARVKPAAPAEGAEGSSRAAIDQVLAVYRQSYNTLDASSVSAVWPAADTQALAEAFAALRYQHLAFERCDVRQTAPDRATASCAASISRVPKAGDPTLQRRRAPWTIELQRVNERWLIASVQTE